MVQILLTTLGFEKQSNIQASKQNLSGIQLQENPLSTYALGLLYIDSFLQKNGHNVTTLLLNNTKIIESKQILSDEIEKNKSEIIGIQILTANRTSSFRIIEWLHEKYPNIKIVIGGIHTTIMYEQVLTKYPYVIAVLGEGEHTFLEIIENPDISKVFGIAYWRNEVIRTQDREQTDLDKLPFPNHDIVLKEPNKILASVITSRGCYSSCSFCCLNPIHKRTVQYRSIQNVIEEIEYIINNYPNINIIFFQDDSFTANPDRVIELCKEIIKRRLNTIDYWCSGRIKPFNLEMVKYMELAGFTKICFGIESGDDIILNKCHKHISSQDIINTASLFKNVNIEFGFFLIVGLPGENKNSIKNTINLIKRIQRDIKYTLIQDAAICTVYPGTELYNIMKGLGKINDEYWMTENPVPIYNVVHSFEELLDMKEELLKPLTLLPLSIERIWYQFPNIINIIKFRNMMKYIGEEKPRLKKQQINLYEK